MGSYKILIKPSAVKEIEAIPQRDRQRLIARIQGLSSDPRPPGSEKLSGQDKFRLRQGVYRIVYSVNDDGPSLLIVKVGHRKRSIGSSTAHVELRLPAPMTIFVARPPSGRHPEMETANKKGEVSK